MGHFFLLGNSWYPLFWNSVRETRRKHDAFLTKTRRGQSEKAKRDKYTTRTGRRLEFASIRLFLAVPLRLKTR